MRNVTLINLANNWINGTLPAWVAELTELRVLNLGSNQGGNVRTAGDGAGGEEEEVMLGLLGSIPKGLNRLTKLRELNLEANSLTGELPRDLCQGGEAGGRGQQQQQWTWVDMKALSEWACVGLRVQRTETGCRCCAALRRVLLLLLQTIAPCCCSTCAATSWRVMRRV